MPRFASSGRIRVRCAALRPELNPIERVWQYIKQKLENIFFTSLDNVKYKVAKILNSLSKDIIRSLTGWQYILDALCL